MKRNGLHRKKPQCVRCWWRRTWGELSVYMGEARPPKKEQTPLYRWHIAVRNAR